jgi:hypothetical protein
MNTNNEVPYDPWLDEWWLAEDLDSVCYPPMPDQLEALFPCLTHRRNASAARRVISARILSTWSVLNNRVPLPVRITSSAFRPPTA